MTGENDNQLFQRMVEEYERKEESPAETTDDERVEDDVAPKKWEWTEPEQNDEKEYEEEPEEDYKEIENEANEAEKEGETYI